MAMRFFYEVEGRGYFLVPEYKVGPKGRIYITGAEMYNKDQQYIGYWHRENMPEKLIHNLGAYVRDWRIRTPLMEPRQRRG